MGGLEEGALAQLRFRLAVVKSLCLTADELLAEAGVIYQVADFPELGPRVGRVFAIVCVVDGDYGCNGVTAELLYSYSGVTQKGVRRGAKGE